VTGLVLFAKTRLPLSVLVGCTAAVLVTTVLQGRRFVPPVIPWDITVLTTPLLPVALAVVAVGACEPVLFVLEQTGPRRRVSMLRVAWAGLLALALGLLSALSTWTANRFGLGEAASPVTTGLSFVSFFALALLAAALVGADLGWTLPCALLVGLVFFGRDADDVARPWAWVLHNPDHLSTWFVPIALAVCALCCYGATDTVGALRASGRR
jgi:hypothetical protein